MIEQTLLSTIHNAGFGNKETIPVAAVRIRRNVFKEMINAQKSACTEHRVAVEQIGLNSQNQGRVGQLA